MNEYVCPCHDAHYTKDGKNLAVAPNPLDEYEVKVEKADCILRSIKAEYKNEYKEAYSDV